MSKLTLLGEISHGEKYEKNGETKWKNTRLGTLWKNDEGEYVVKMLGQFCKVWPPKADSNDYQQAREAVQTVDDESDTIPF